MRRIGLCVALAAGCTKGEDTSGDTNVADTDTDTDADADTDTDADADADTGSAPKPAACGCAATPNATHFGLLAALLGLTVSRRGRGVQGGREQA